MPDGSGGMDDEAWDEAASATSSASRAPSLHPSMAGTAVSMACSEDTIGAGDDTEYWDFQHRTVTAKDLGHTCRECRLPFTNIGDPLTERRGARISSRYHAECFSGYADPRSQVGSSHHSGKLAGTQMEAAPATKATSKMRTGSHFTGGGAVRGASMGGKHGGAMGMGSLGFGAASSKGAAGVAPAPAPGGFTAAELLQHTEAAAGAPAAAVRQDAMARFLGDGQAALEPEPEPEPEPGPA